MSPKDTIFWWTVNSYFALGRVAQFKSAKHMIDTGPVFICEWLNPCSNMGASNFWLLGQPVTLYIILWSFNLNNPPKEIMVICSGPAGHIRLLIVTIHGLLLPDYMLTRIGLFSFGLGKQWSCNGWCGPLSCVQMNLHSIVDSMFKCYLPTLPSRWG